MNENMLSEALKLCVNDHHGQFDKGGAPYSLHPLKVMYYLKTDDLELMQIGVLHDWVEDCGGTYERLRQLGFSERVIAGIRALTKVPGQTEEEYLQAILANRDAVLVKLADLRHNSDIRRLKGVTEKDQKRLDKYCKMYNILKEHVKSWS